MFIKKRRLCIILLFVLLGITHAASNREKKPFNEPIVSEHASNNLIDQELTPINFDKKKALAIELVSKAVDFFQKNTLDVALGSFAHSKDFVHGELAVFVFDAEGYCLAYGSEPTHLWKNLYNYRDTFGTPIVQVMIEKAQAGGGWITYEWKHATQVSYVKGVEKDGHFYAIGSGYFPISKESAAVSLVKGAVALFNQGIKEGKSTSEIFSQLSYPTGRFINGDLFLTAYDFNGFTYAYAEQPGLIGTNRLEVKDRRGQYPIKLLINAVKDYDLGIGNWIEFERRNATKRAYVERVQDADGKNYVISCGYYPDIDRNQVIDLVRRGYEFLRKVGLKDAAASFTDVNDHTYNYGGLFLIVFNMKGVCLADGSNPDNVGQNMLNFKDEDGNFYVQEILKKATPRGGWINTRLRNALVSLYIKLAQVGNENVVLVAPLFPVTKRESMVLLTKNAVEFLRDNTEQVAFSEFVKSDGPYVRGDLHVFVYDSSGTCLIYGDDRDIIWLDFMNAKDDDGRPFVKIMINTALRGPSTVQYTLNNAKCVAYIENIEKNGKIYTVGSSYYP